MSGKLGAQSADLGHASLSKQGRWNDLAKIDDLGGADFQVKRRSETNRLLKPRFRRPKSPIA
jgi:hypothetical protein